MFKFTFIKQTQSQAAPLTVTTESGCRGQEVQGLHGRVWACTALTSHCLCPQNRGEKELQGALHPPWFLNPRFPEGHFSRSQQSFSHGVQVAWWGLAMDIKNACSCGPDHQHSCHSQHSMGLRNTKDNVGTNGPGAL